MLAGRFGLPGWRHSHLAWGSRRPHAVNSERYWFVSRLANVSNRVAERMVDASSPTCTDSACAAGRLCHCLWGQNCEVSGPIGDSQNGAAPVAKVTLTLVETGACVRWFRAQRATPRFPSCCRNLNLKVHPPLLVGAAIER
jgi:hypothetical protein